VHRRFLRAKINRANKFQWIEKDLYKTSPRTSANHKRESPRRRAPHPGFFDFKPDINKLQKMGVLFNSDSIYVAMTPGHTYTKSRTFLED